MLAALLEGRGACCPSLSVPRLVQSEWCDRALRCRSRARNPEAIQKYLENMHER